jgi:hypothetical protein
MTLLQKKNKLIKAINSVENPELLDDLFKLLNLELEDIEKLKIPFNTKESVTKGHWDIRNGRYISNRKADSEIEQWLKK